MCILLTQNRKLHLRIKLVRITPSLFPQNLPTSYGCWPLWSVLLAPRKNAAGGAVRMMRTILHSTNIHKRNQRPYIKWRFRRAICIFRKPQAVPFMGKTQRKSCVSLKAGNEVDPVQLHPKGTICAFRENPLFFDKIYVIITYPRPKYIKNGERHGKRKGLQRDTLRQKGQAL